MVRLDALRPLHSFVARFFTHPRVREAFSFHSLFIGGDPYRVPAIYGALVHLQVADGGWYADGGVYSRGRGDGAPARRALRRAGRGDRARRRPRDRRAARRRRADRRPTSWSPTPTCCAPTSCVGRRAAAPPAARDDVVLPALPRHGPAVRRGCCTTRCWSATATRSSSARSPAAASCRGRTRPTSTRRRAPSRRWPRRAATRSRVLLPVPNLRAGDRLGRARPTGCATRSSPTSRRRSGSAGSTRRVARRAPDDAAGLRARPRRGVGQRVRGRADAAPVRLLPPAQPRPPAGAASTSSAAGRTPAPASPACCSAPRSPRAWSPPTAAAGAPAGGRR